jgi:formylglycine-generating enzyme required for sulfatase activity
VNETQGSLGPHNLQQTSAVGLYPQRESPYGILDLSSNVWEWCLNEFNDPERIQDEEDKLRVLRGGSWESSPNGASASSRFVDDFPWNRNFYDGFRCVVVPISHG